MKRLIALCMVFALFSLAGAAFAEAAPVIRLQDEMIDDENVTQISRIRTLFKYRFLCIFRIFPRKLEVKCIGVMSFLFYPFYHVKEKKVSLYDNIG